MAKNTKKIRAVTNALEVSNPVYGYTHMNRSVRVTLKITPTEYILMDLLDHLSKTKPFDQLIYKTIWEYTGLEVPACKRCIARCRLKGLIDKIPNERTKDLADDDPKKKYHLWPSAKWKEQFEFKDEFEKFWERHHRGNKQAARKFFIGAVKKAGWKTIFDKYKEYYEWCEKTFTYELNTSSWLNPTLERWNDELIKQKERPVPEVIKEDNIDDF